MQEQNEFQPSFADPTQPMEAEERTFYRNSTRDLVSRVAYLIGVPKRMFENEHEPPQLDIYDRLDKEKNARIIRNLCLIRTAIQRNFKYINEGMRFEHRSILTMPEYVPVESINQLELDGVRFIKKSSIKLYQHIIEINRVISDRINNCKPLFPLWLNWEYIRDLIVMPDGLTEAGTKAAADRYYANQAFRIFQSQYLYPFLFDAFFEGEQRHKNSVGQVKTSHMQPQLTAVNPRKIQHGAHQTG